MQRFESLPTHYEVYPLRSLPTTKFTHYSMYHNLPTRAIRITIPGEPLGYNTALRSWNRKSVSVRKWYVKVCEYFNKAGVSTPLFADDVYPVHIHVTAYYGSARHCDPGNTHKGLIDALFYKSVGPGDKFVGGSFDVPLYDAENPRTEVEMRGWYLRKKYAHLASLTW